MGGGMPYHLEKGVTLRLIEQYLNSDRGKMRDALRGLRSASPYRWVKDVIPQLWQDEGFDVRTSSAEHVMRDWFGLASDGEEPQQRPAQADERDDDSSTGYWIGYGGDVEAIVRGSFVLALELALGLEPSAPGSPPADLDVVPDTGPDPDAIELFWSCDTPWFEAWVVRRPVDLRPLAGQTAVTERGRGMVTIHFHTPSHKGASVSETPIPGKDAYLALTTPDGELLPHPVPSLEIDYQQSATSGTTTTSCPTVLGRRPVKGGSPRGW